MMMMRMTMGMLMKAMMIATSPPSSAVSPQSIESLDMWVSRPRLEKMMIILMILMMTMVIFMMTLLSLWTCGLADPDCG